MKSRLTGVIIGQIIGIIIVCMAASFIALVSFGGIAGVTMASDPENIFKLAAPFTCPNGTVNFESYKASYNRPGESNVYVECIEGDVSTDITLQSIGVALLGFYLACFLPLCIPGGLAAIIIPLFFLRGGKKKDTSPPSAIEIL